MIPRRPPQALLVCLLAVTAGCVEEASTGPRPGLDVRGGYAGTWEVEKTNLLTQEVEIERCVGMLTIDEQTAAGGLAGAFRIRADDEGCSERAGSVEGEIREGGAIVLLLVVPGGSEIDFEDLTGCLFSVGGNAFAASLAEDRLTAAATFLGECEGALSEVTIRFDGER